MTKQDQYSVDWEQLFANYKIKMPEANYAPLKRELKALLQAERREAVEKVLRELKRELSFHTVSEKRDEMSRSYVINTLNYKLKELSKLKEK